MLKLFKKFRKNKVDKIKFVVLIDNGDGYIEDWEPFYFNDRSDAVAYKAKLLRNGDTRKMVVTTEHCARCCYGILK